MHKFNLKSPSSFFFIVLLVIGVFSFIPPSYADRVITIQKVSNVNELSLLNALSNVSEYPQIFPDNVKYVKILDNNTKLVEMDAGINGIFFDTKAICTTDANGNYVVQIVSGDLNGTVMTTSLQQTWGFQGQKDGGTIANIDLNVKTTGILSWMLNFIPDSTVSDALGYGFDKFIEYVQTT
ncbi:hypothetical protein [Candidatus Nitrosotalea bavarica]|uniref:hypothetical protein n=1 Tax=Candidatus Nitrosotalea bavarica TaxID=1903277 RepID=UPI000C7117AC|nr:hypothetical protein [Candidatus Nitrosotalea bavarica]